MLQLRSKRLRNGGTLTRWTALAAVAVSLALAPPVGAQLPAPPVVGNGAFQLGGYGALTFSRPEHPEAVEKIGVSELAVALLAWGQITTRASYLVELDMAKRISDTWTGREATEHFAPVRLYMEYSASDLFRLRVGRFLTPVGQWNERHAEPLTWTPNRPLTTYRPFAKSLNGILAAGEGSLGRHDVGYAVFWAPSWDLDGGIESSEESSFINAAGARLAIELRPSLTLGVSAARMRRSHPLDPFEDSLGIRPVLSVRVPWGEAPVADVVDPDREQDEAPRALLGADVRWAATRAEITAEGAWLPARGLEPEEGGAFLLGALRVAGPVWGVVRAEFYRPVDPGTARTLWTGITVRSGPHLVLKFGRQFSKRPSRKIPDGWLLSFSSLF